MGVYIYISLLLLSMLYYVIVLLHDFYYLYMRDGKTWESRKTDKKKLPCCTRCRTVVHYCRKHATGRTAAAVLHAGSKHATV